MPLPNLRAMRGAAPAPAPAPRAPARAQGPRARAARARSARGAGGAVRKPQRTRGVGSQQHSILCFLINTLFSPHIAGPTDNSVSPSDGASWEHDGA